MQQGERQVAPALSGVRRDHVARYEWAAKLLDKLGPKASGNHTSVIDLACGIGYGAKIMADAGHSVLAADRDNEALAYAKEHYEHPSVDYFQGDANWLARKLSSRYDAVVCFETIEHLWDPQPVLGALANASNMLLASVPNETVFPYHEGIKHHFRHYTAAEFQQLLNASGWQVVEWHGQRGPESEVERDVLGRTLIAVCERSLFPKKLAFEPVNTVATVTEVAKSEPEAAGIGHVVILGLGPSAEQYMDMVKRLGGRKAFADHVWAINALGDVLACDLVFHMDDIRVQEMRAAAAPESNIANMVKWLRTHSGPVMTSRAHPDYPALVEFPLEDVINTLGYAYFNGTAAYAVAYAIYRGASKISFFGCDFSMPNRHHVEQGRACVEFWIGFAAARGIELGFADGTSLMDTCAEPKDPNEIGVYGFDFDRVMVETVSGSAKITLEPRPVRPTAAEIEARYDHSAHPAPQQR